MLRQLQMYYAISDNAILGTHKFHYRPDFHRIYEKAAREHWTNDQILMVTRIKLRYGLELCGARRFPTLRGVYGYTETVFYTAR